MRPNLLETITLIAGGMKIEEDPEMGKGGWIDLTPLPMHSWLFKEMSKAYAQLVSQRPSLA